MPIVAVLRDFVSRLDEVDDFRKDMPIIAELKKQTLRAIVELEMARIGRITPESAPVPRQHGAPKRGKEST